MMNGIEILAVSAVVTLTSCAVAFSVLKWKLGLDTKQSIFGAAAWPLTLLFFLEFVYQDQPHYYPDDEEKIEAANQRSSEIDDWSELKSN